MPGGPRFPLHIVHLILQHFNGGRWFSVERPTLICCSLVCRAWRDIAQALLYKNVNLWTHERFDLFRDFVHANPRIAAAVRELLFQVSFCEDLYQLPPSLLLEILEALPNIRCLELEGVTLLGWPAYNALPPEPFKLSKLMLTDVQNGPYFNRHCLRFDFLRLFTEIDELQVVGSVEDEEVAGKVTASRRGIPPPIVRKLVIAGPDSILDYNDKCGGLNKEHLRALQVDVSDKVSLRYAGKMLRRYGENMRDLDLDLCTAVAQVKPKDTRLWKGLEAGKLSRVERLTLHIRDHGRATEWTVEQADQEFCKAYGAVLSAIPSGTLRELKWALPGPRDEEAFSSSARCLAPLLLQAVEKFPTLETITLVLWRELPFERCTAALHSMLPEKVLQRDVIRLEKWTSKYIGQFTVD
ncbi:hypothetical protein OH77DRAFT_1522979 [Trametes cingulata]|nr:hypothetical protein OH77DRAFT_1522979 [Trametes cingulata]